MLFRFSSLLLSLAITVTRASAYTYPSSITLTNDTAIEDVLADIPFFSVGLVGFGVFTFFFVMRRINWLTVYIHLAVLLAFLASIFDLSQIIRRGSYNMSHNLGASSVRVLLILRELGFALSFGFRFFFFWVFVSEPPRGELPFLPLPDDRRANFISLDSESNLHSGSWKRWSYLGFVLKWGLLLMTIAVPVLQGLWRLVDSLNKFGPVYYTEGGIEIVLSAVFILKLLANTFMSPLTPRWKTLRDYLPPILALGIGMGVGIGNILCLAFSDSILGTFLQAVELYILILFVLLSAFYKMPVRSSVVAELVRRRLDATGNMNRQNPRQYAFSMVNAPVTAPDGELREDSRSRRSGQSGRPSLTQRISSGSIFSSRLIPGRTSGRLGSVQALGNEKDDEGDQRRLWSQDEAERGQSPVDQRTPRISLEQTPTQTPMAETKDAPGWRDPMLTSVIKPDQILSSNLGRSPPAIIGPSPPANLRQSVQLSAERQQFYSQYATDMTLPRSFAREGTDSPIYGLDGIIRSLQTDSTVPGRESNIDSARSSGMESLMRQQEELDKSVASLRRFSTNSKQSVPRIASSSYQSDFSLSNFPDPPMFGQSVISLNVVSTPTTPETARRNADTSLPVSEMDRSNLSTSDNSLIVDDVTFQLVPPQMPAALAEPSRSQNPSVPSIARESLDSVLGTTIPGRTIRADSQGTQYDVTSFIGGLTTPQINIVSPLVSNTEREKTNMESDNDSIVPATISAVTRVQVFDSRQPNGPDASNEGESKQQYVTAEVTATAMGPSQSQIPAIPLTSGSAPKETASVRPALGLAGLSSGFVKARGLPTGPRGRLEISNPIPRQSGVLDERTAFQRPRPAPLALQQQKSDEAQTPPAPNASQPSGYF